MEEIIKKLGFDSIEDFHKLNANIDISNDEKMTRYLDWRNNDGSKSSLIKLIEINNKI